MGAGSKVIELVRDFHNILSSGFQFVRVSTNENEYLVGEFVTRTPIARRSEKERSDDE